MIFYLICFTSFFIGVKLHITVKKRRRLKVDEEYKKAQEDSSQAMLIWEGKYYWQFVDKNKIIEFNKDKNN